MHKQDRVSSDQTNPSFFSTDDVGEKMQRRLPSISSARFSSGGSQCCLFFVVVVFVVVVVVAVSAQLHPAKGPCGVGKEGIRHTRGWGGGGDGMADKEARGDGRLRQAGVTHAVGRGREEGGRFLFFLKKKGGKKAKCYRSHHRFSKRKRKKIHLDLPKTKLER